MTRILTGIARVGLESLRRRRATDSYSDPSPRTPTIADCFGKPLPPPRLEIAAPLPVDECVNRFKSALGRRSVDLEDVGAREANVREPVSVLLMMTGRYQLPGLLQRQLVRGVLEPRGSGTRLDLHLSPRSDSSNLGKMLTTVALAFIASFTFLTWITGPSDISLLGVAALSVPIGTTAGALTQGLLNGRGHLKERRRLTRTAARLATLLDGAVVRWP